MELCTCGHSLVDHHPCGTCEHDCDCLRFFPIKKNSGDEMEVQNHDDYDG